MGASVSPQHRAELKEQFDAAVKAQGFCTEYGVTSDPSADGPVSFECECGRFSGSFADLGVANRVLDDHLDDQERAFADFHKRWWAEHGETSP